MVADEITYGADIETALRALQDRVGQEDLTLFVTSVGDPEHDRRQPEPDPRQPLQGHPRALQDAPQDPGPVGGGPRQRDDPEPDALRGLRDDQPVSPSFYGDVWDYPSAPYVLGGALSWMFVGNMVMRRMVNFKI